MRPEGYSARQAAKVCGIGRATVQRALQDGRLQGKKKDGVWVIAPRALEAAGFLPKPDDSFSDRVWKRAYESMRRERDAAVRRAKQAETEFEKAKNSTLSQLDWAGFLCGEEYQDLVERAEQAERELGELRSKVNAWGREHSAPALSRADIEKVVAEWVDDAPEIVNEVWALVSGADPAVYVIRESDLPTVQQDEDGEWYPGDRWDLADDRFIDVEGALEKMHLYAAIARAIEAKQDVDPVGLRAQELYELSGLIGPEAWAACRNIAAKELGLA